VLPGDRSQLLITYAEVCIQHGQTITTEGWGFVLYNWKTHRIAYGPDHVLAPHKNGSAISSAQIFVTAVFDGNRLTLFSDECIAPSASCQVGEVWFASMPATVAALHNPASYQTQLLPLSLQPRGRRCPSR
jgi:hypothetical protein